MMAQYWKLLLNISTELYREQLVIKCDRIGAGAGRELIKDMRGNRDILPCGGIKFYNQLHNMHQSVHHFQSMDPDKKAVAESLIKGMNSVFHLHVL